MRPRMTILWLAPLVAFSCTDSEGERGCPDGTAAIEGACVPLTELCAGDGVWDGTTCVDAGCVEGYASIEGVCVALAEICPAGEVWDGANCLDDGCGPGLANVGGTCVPTGELCSGTRVWVDGACREERTCGNGTTEVAGACVPVDPLEDADGFEAAEPNDSALGGTPASLVLPPLDQTVFLAGSIALPVDVDGDAVVDPDFDTWRFSGAAGQRLRVEVTAVGVPSAALVIEDGSGFWRAALPFGTRNAGREIVLPRTGTYDVSVGDAGNFVRRYEELPGGGPVWDGNSDYTYLLAITSVAGVTSADETSAELDVVGALADIRQWRLQLPAYTLVAIDFSSVEGVEPHLSVGSPDYAMTHGVGPGTYVVPASGEFLITADYLYALTGDTSFSLTMRELPAAAVDVVAGADLSAQLIEPGGGVFYRFEVTNRAIAQVDFYPSASSTTLFVRDAAWTELVGIDSGDFMLALEPGVYFLQLRDTSLPGFPASFSYDLFVASLPVNVFDSGLLDAGTTSLVAAALDSLQPEDAVAFYTFETGDIGDLSIGVTPGSDLDVDVLAFETSLVAWQGAYRAMAGFDFIASGGGTTGADTQNLAPPRRYYLRLANAMGGPAPSGAAGEISVNATFTHVSGLVAEVEPNNGHSAAGGLGTLDTDATGGYDQVTAWGELTAVNGSTVDVWTFNLSQPAHVLAAMNRAIGQTPRPEQTLLTLISSAGTVDAHEFVVGGHLAPGDYTILVEAFPGSGPLPLPGSPYLLDVLVTESYSVCLPDRRSCQSGALSVCNAGGDGLNPSLWCSSGCDSQGEYCASQPEVEVNDALSIATDLGTLSENVTLVAGFIEERSGSRDQDWFVFSLEAASELSVETRGDADGVILDTEILLLDSDDNILGSNDDRDGALCAGGSPAGCLSRVRSVVPSGAYAVRITSSLAISSAPTGPYVLDVTFVVQ